MNRISEQIKPFSSWLTPYRRDLVSSCKHLSVTLWVLGFSGPVISDCSLAATLHNMSAFFPSHMVEKANNMFKQHAIRHPEHACHPRNSTAADSGAREPAGIWLQLACMNSALSKQPSSVYSGLNINPRSLFSVAWGLASYLYRAVRGNDVVEGDLQKLLNVQGRPGCPAGPAKTLKAVSAAHWHVVRQGTITASRQVLHPQRHIPPSVLSSKWRHAASEV